jgi:hypothetical protein
MSRSDPLLVGGAATAVATLLVHREKQVWSCAELARVIRELRR